GLRPPGLRAVPTGAPRPRPLAPRPLQHPGPGGPWSIRPGIAGAAGAPGTGPPADDRLQHRAATLSPPLLGPHVSHRPARARSPPDRPRGQPAHGAAIGR